MVLVQEGHKVELSHNILRSADVNASTHHTLPHINSNLRAHRFSYFDLPTVAAYAYTTLKPTSILALSTLHVYSEAGQ